MRKSQENQFEWV
jgi:hypothetical protein